MKRALVSRHRRNVELGQLERRLLFAANTPFTANGQPWTISASGPSWVEAENYDYGGNGTAYSASAKSNQGGAYRTGEVVGIEGPSANTGGTYDVGYVNAGEWLKYTVNVAAAGTYVINLRASDAGGAASAHVGFSGGSGPAANTGTISVPNTGGWGNYANHTAVLSLSAGTQVMTVFDDVNNCNFDYIGITPSAYAGSAEQGYNPTNPGSTTPTFRGIPTLLPAYGAAQIESEYFDTGGQAAAATGVQSGGYYWADSSVDKANYPYTPTAFRPTDTIDMADTGTGIVTTNWVDGDWAQYTVVSAANVPPINPQNVLPSYQAVSPTLTYQLQISYSNGGGTASSFAMDDTTTDPSTGTSSVTRLTTLSLAPTGGNFQIVTATITLPRNGMNILRLVDADSAGVNNNVNVDFFKLINSTTTGNGGVPWEVPAGGSTTHIPADDYDAAPGSASFTPAIAPTADGTSGGNDVTGMSAGNALSYTISTDQPGKYLLALRLADTGSTAAQVQVSFDSGAAFGATADTVTFLFNVSAGSQYQTVTTGTNVGQNPQVTANWVEAQAGVQKMQIKVLTGTINLHYVELSAITTTTAVKPDPTESGSYAADPPTSALDSASDTFDRVYNTNYDWINPPANAPVPTNDWWTNILASQFAGDMYAYPEKINDSANGVAVSSFSTLGTNANGNTIQMNGQQSVVVGAAGTSFTEDALLDYADWTVHYRMKTATANQSLDVTMGRGLPYTWVEFNGGLTPTVTLHAGGDANQNTDTLYDANGNVLTGTFTTDHFRVNTGAEQLAVFAPAGTTFTPSGTTYTVTFAAGVAHYLVTAVLPDSTNATLATFYQHAYAIPRQVGATQSSTYTWTYSAAAGTVTTHWSLNLVAIDPANPPASLTTIQGWLPLDYTDGATGPTMLAGFYPSINGNIEMSVGSSFAIAQTTDGINFDLALPQAIGAPAVAYDPNNPGTTTVSTDYSPQQMLAYIHLYIQQQTNAAASAAAGTTILNYGNDTYFGAKPLQEYAEFALMSKQIGDTADFNIFLSNLTTFMTDWFTYTPGESAHYFAYYPGTHSLTGFDPAYGSEDFTDNHFHYGYFTAAAGVLALLNPTWAAQYGSMAKMVAMQYANWIHPGDTPDVTDPNATSLPFLRTFEPWVGHSYAGGTSSGGGNNQESSSEAIQSWLGMVLLGQALNDPSLTAAGMMGYTMESKAVREQWFNQAPGAADPNGLAFPASYNDSNGSTVLSNVAIDFDGGKSYATYFGANPEYILGIESLPIWPSLDFLGENAAAAAAATQSMLNQRAVESGNPADATFASFEDGGENDWLNIALGFQAQYNPQATALQYARMIAQQTPTGVTGTTGLYYFQDQSYQTYGLRNWSEHLSLPLGGVYSHGTDSTSMSGTTSYMVWNPGTSATTVNVYNAADAVVDSFTAQPGYNVVTRSSAGGNAPPLIVTGATASPTTVTGTTANLSVLATDQQQNESNLMYRWTLANGPAGATPTFSINGTNAAKNTVVTFNAAGAYTFIVTATDVDGLSASTTVAVTVTAALVQITVSPTSALLLTNGTQAFTAVGTDQFGNRVSNPVVTWAVTAGGGNVTTTGVYTAPAGAGTATVTASGGSATGSATVTIGLPIAPPTNVTSLWMGTNEVDLSWTPPSGNVSGYNVYRGTTPGGEGSAPINASPLTGTTYRDTAVSGNTSYFYVVRSVGSGGPGTPSTEVSATTATDLALNKSAYASSTENNTLTANLAVDGNSTTRWSTQFSDPQWIYVNLGATYTIGEVKINWENAAGKDYQIQTSSDAINWSTAVTVTGNLTAGWHDYSGLAATGQYVRVYGTARDTGYGYSIYDLNVYAAVATSPLVLSGSNYLAVDPALPGQLDVWSGTTNNGTPSATYNLASLSSITVNAAAMTDRLTLDFSHGDPITAGITFDGLGGGSDSIVIKGDNAGDGFNISAGQIVVTPGTNAAATLRFSNAAAITIVGGNGNDTLLQSAGSGAAVTYVAGAGTDTINVAAESGSINLTGPATLQTLTIGADARVNFVSTTDRSLLIVNSLSLAQTAGAWSATLDLGGNDLIVHGGDLWTIDSAIGSASSFGNWTGRGIFSSAAAADPLHLHALGAVLNVDPKGNPLYGSGAALGLFDGQSPAAGDVLVRYTFLGDANLDGKVDGSDYSLIDAGFKSGNRGWYNGDFNYDGVVDGSDYSEIDNAFNNQSGASLPALADISATTATQVVSAAPPRPSRWAAERGADNLNDAELPTAPAFDAFVGIGSQDYLQNNPGYAFDMGGVEELLDAEAYGHKLKRPFSDVEISPEN